jgi:hypothetical protein
MLAPAGAAQDPRAHRKRAARVAVAVLTTALLLAAIAARRDELAVSVSLLGRLDWTWIAAAIALETASMSAFSELQRRPAAHRPPRPPGARRHRRDQSLDAAVGMQTVLEAVEHGSDTGDGHAHGQPRQQQRGGQEPARPRRAGQAVRLRRQWLHALQHAGLPARPLRRTAPLT